MSRYGPLVDGSTMASPPAPFLIAIARFKSWTIFWFLSIFWIQEGRRFQNVEKKTKLSPGLESCNRYYEGAVSPKFQCYSVPYMTSVFGRRFVWFVVPPIASQEPRPVLLSILSHPGSVQRAMKQSRPFPENCCSSCGFHFCSTHRYSRLVETWKWKPQHSHLKFWIWICLKF